MTRTVLFAAAAMLLHAAIPSSAHWHPPFYKLSVDTTQDVLWEVQPDGQTGFTRALHGASLKLEDTTLSGEIDLFKAQIEGESVETDIKKATFRVLTTSEERIITVEDSNGAFAWTLEIDDDLDGNFEAQTLVACDYDDCDGMGPPPEFYGPVTLAGITVITVDDETEDADYVVIKGKD